MFFFFFFSIKYRNLQLIKTVLEKWNTWSEAFHDQPEQTVAAGIFLKKKTNQLTKTTTIKTQLK